MTYKVLAVALTGTVSTGCSRAPSPEGRAEGLGASTLASQASSAPTQASTPPVAPSAEKVLPEPTAELHALRDELLNAGRTKALANLGHFRPLCDKDGYPLVGNAFRKNPNPEYQPSELCTEVRKK